MTVLAAGWENLGGRTLIDRSGVPGKTISHPLNAALPGDADATLGSYNISTWTNVAAGDFPRGMGAEVADAVADTLAEAFAATPA